MKKIIYFLLIVLLLWAAVGCFYSGDKLNQDKLKLLCPEKLDAVFKAYHFDDSQQNIHSYNVECVSANWDVINGDIIIDPESICSYVSPDNEINPDESELSLNKDMLEISCSWTHMAKEVKTINGQAKFIDTELTQTLIVTVNDLKFNHDELELLCSKKLDGVLKGDNIINGNQNRVNNNVECESTNGDIIIDPKSICSSVSPYAPDEFGSSSNIDTDMLEIFCSWTHIDKSMNLTQTLTVTVNPVLSASETCQFTQVVALNNFYKEKYPDGYEDTDDVINPNINQVLFSLNEALTQFNSYMNQYIVPDVISQFAQAMIILFGENDCDLEKYPNNHFGGTNSLYVRGANDIYYFKEFTLYSVNNDDPTGEVKGAHSVICKVRDDSINPEDAEDCVDW